MVRAVKLGRGFPLLEVLAAPLLMRIEIAGILSGLAAASRNAARLTDYDRATLLARQKMDELMVDHKVPRKVPLEGTFDPALVGGAVAGWHARVMPYEWAPGAGPGMWGVDRI